jgi:hypothetical protein
MFIIGFGGKKPLDAVVDDLSFYDGSGMKGGGIGDSRRFGGAPGDAGRDNGDT